MLKTVLYLCVSNISVVSINVKLFANFHYHIFRLKYILRFVTHLKFFESNFLNQSYGQSKWKKSLHLTNLSVCQQKHMWKYFINTETYSLIFSNRNYRKAIENERSGVKYVGVLILNKVVFCYWLAIIGYTFSLENWWHWDVLELSSSLWHNFLIYAIRSSG